MNRQTISCGYRVVHDVHFSSLIADHYNVVNNFSNIYIAVLVYRPIFNTLL